LPQRIKALSKKPVKAKKAKAAKKATPKKVVKKPVKKAATKAVKKKAPAKKSTVKKVVKKAAVKLAKTPAKKPVKKVAAKVVKKLVKKSPAKKSAVKSVAIKKAIVKKAIAKKTVAKKATVKKAAVKKTAVTKSPAKKAVKKIAAKKPVVKLAPKPVYHFEGPAAPQVKLILAALDDAKAENTLAINIAGRSAMADAMVITTGRVNRHVSAIADQLLSKLKNAGTKNLRVEGQETGDWCLIDTGDVIIHIFRPEVRSFYNLEKLWSADAPAGI
jgi:ribosome-associated protein